MLFPSQEGITVASEKCKMQTISVKTGQRDHATAFSPTMESPTLHLSHSERHHCGFRTEGHHVPVGHKGPDIPSMRWNISALCAPRNCIRSHRVWMLLGRELYQVGARTENALDLVKDSCISLESCSQ